MKLADRLRQLVGALPSDDSSVTLTRVDLLALLEGEADDVPASRPRDLTVEQVAEEVQRSPSTVRRWLIADEIPQAYKLQGRDWRVPPAALRAYLDRQAGEDDDDDAPEEGEVDIGAWRRLREPAAS